MATSSNGADQLRQLAQRLRDASVATARAEREATRDVGIKALSYVWEDFRVKARGGSCPQGISWGPITIFSIAGRLMQRKVGEELLRKLPRGRDRDANRAAIIRRACTDPSFLPRFYAAVQQEFALHEIGVNTGRLVNSLIFGREGNVFREGSNQVEVGTDVIDLASGLHYADEFHRRRKIVPDQFTPERIKQLEKLAASTFEKAMRQALGPLANAGG
jgi:hypothetical protein